MAEGKSQTPVFQNPLGSCGCLEAALKYWRDPVNFYKSVDFATTLFSLSVQLETALPPSLSSSIRQGPIYENLRLEKALVLFSGVLEANGGSRELHGLSADPRGCSKALSSGQELKHTSRLSDVERSEVHLF